jgi:hypothetical protein
VRRSRAEGEQSSGSFAARPIIIEQLRKRVPDELQERVGKKEERRSLKTKNPAEAKLRLSQALIELETKWANVKRGSVTLTEVQAHALAALSSIGGYKFTKTTQRTANLEYGARR